jgi:hypothetical protein
VATRFRAYGYPAFMRNLQVDGRDPIDWLMEQREYWHYRSGRFSDPDMPDILSHFDCGKAARLLEAYLADSTGVFLADPSHAMISIPFRLLHWAIGSNPFQSPGVVDPDDLKFLKLGCRLQGRKLATLERLLLT